MGWATICAIFYYTHLVTLVMGWSNKSHVPRCVLLYSTYENLCYLERD
jgi:hypothetical protein